MCKAKILSNLKGRVNFVSPFCATSGLEHGLTDLHDLVREGLVEKQMVLHGVDKFNRDIVLPMYRAYPSAHKLTLVK